MGLPVSWIPTKIHSSSFRHHPFLHRAPSESLGMAHPGDVFRVLTSKFGVQATLHFFIVLTHKLSSSSPTTGQGYQETRVSPLHGHLSSCSFFLNLVASILQEKPGKTLVFRSGHHASLCLMQVHRVRLRWSAAFLY